MERRSVLKGIAGVSAAAWLPVGPATAQTTKTLVIMTPELVMLTGAFNSAGTIYLMSAKIFDGLVEYDFDFNMKPQLAESWEISEDMKTMKFSLKPGVKWHDGKEFTSHDVAWSAINVWQKLHPRGRATFANLEGVDTPDDVTAIFRFSKSSPAVLKALHSTESQILPKHLYEGTDIVTNPLNVAPVGTGPFRFVQWERGSHVTLERNPDYWDAGKPMVDRLVIRTISDNTARAAAVESQEVLAGGGSPLPMREAERLSEKPYLMIPEKGDEAFGGQAWMEFNLRRPIFQDLRVRQAIAHAINREQLMKIVWYGFGSPGTGPINPGMKPFYTPDVPRYDFDLEKAAALLDEAGYPLKADGTRFEITHDPMPYSQEYFRTGDFVKQALSKVGIVVNIRSQDIATWLRRIYTERDFDTINASAHNLTDPAIGVQRFFWSKNIIDGVPFSNGSGYANQQVDQILETAQSEPNTEKRIELYQQFQKLVAAELPQIALVNLPWMTIQNRRVTPLDDTPYGAHGNFANVTLS